MYWFIIPVEHQIINAIKTSLYFVGLKILLKNFFFVSDIWILMYKS